MHGLYRWLFLIFALSVNCASAERAALVIGNANYSQMSPLSGPGNDAADMAAALKSVGFRVFPVAKDLREAELLKQVEDFAMQARGAEVALLYYSGHGVQLQGSNYLLPVDADPSSEAQLRADGVAVDLVVDTLRRGGAASTVVILDACRDNPIPSAFKSAGKGLARMESPQGFLIAYATAAGAVARDLGSNGRNSPYAQALLTELQHDPHVELEVFMRRVGTRVFASTNQQQFPATYNALTTSVVLSGARPAGAGVADLAPGEGELRLTVTPADATVRLNGALVGQGSRSIRRPGGTELAVKAEAPGYAPIEERVVIEGGQVSTISLILRPQGGAAPVDVTSSPPPPNRPPADPAAIAAAYENAFTSLKEGRYKDSISLFAAFVQTYPDSESTPNAMYWLAESYYVTQNNQQALETFEALIRRFPNSTKAPDAWLKVGYCQGELGRKDAAKATLSDVARRYPDTAVGRLAQNRLRYLGLE